ncbi:serine/threonine protein kinase [Anaerobutyricum hallii]|uniref:Serine/threonine protein kinase n=4 Tax=Anaerobutyricum hallii TaxID=39488 RepID=A0A415G8S1_9FIRM|nr:serine/threonine-protein kinase [Anaerobutyricum hallii]RHK40148.1 serine/threonine protein kinase [Anaerobutyricum hallii]
MEKENWLLEETLLHEKYQIKKVLGQGGFGITYLAYDQTLQQNVAIKEYFPVKIVRRLGNTLRKGQGEYELSATAMVYPQNGQEEKYLNGMQNFLEEAQVLFGKFDVEGLAAVKDYFEENGTAYIVMEYLSGPTLQEYEKEHKGKISEKQAEILLEPVINALAYIHSIGIVHCDISPDNLIFNKEGQLKLIDFGAAKNKKKEKEEQYCKGGYTAPEQYLEKEFVGPWSDVYSLCAVWYEMLTGIKVPPAVERLQKDRLKNMTMASEVSEQTNNILKKGLSLEIQKRYFSVLNLSCDIKSNMESKEEITKQYMKDTRFVWGTLWLQITTDINERNISQEKKWLSRRKIRKGIYAVGIVLLLFLCGISGREYYIRSYPQQYFTYKAKQKNDYYILHPRDKEYTTQMSGYDSLMKKIKKYSYKKENWGVLACYSISEQEVKKLNLVSNEYFKFALSETEIEKAILLCMNIKKRDLESTAYASEGQVYQRQQGKLKSLTVGFQKQKLVTCMDHEQIKIIYDPIDKGVYKVAFQGSYERVKLFMKKMNSILCPQNYLTTEDYNYILDHYKSGKSDYVSYKLGRQYKIMLDTTDEEETEYKDYEVSIQGDQFISNIY